MIVVVGAGLAGLQTVTALRQQGYDGPLTLLGAEERLPYDRPPLSKELLRGDVDSSALDADWPTLGVEPRLGIRVETVGDGVLATTAGEIGFDRCVLATGATPRTLPGTARTLRTHEDAVALREALQPGARIAIVGAGWIGAEVATAAVKAGAEVTVIEGLPAPLASALPVDVGARTQPWWAGVDLRLGAFVDRVEPDAVHLADGETVRADLVLVAIGARPAAPNGPYLTAEGAVAVDPQLRTSVPNVWAVGDCAAWESARYATRMLVEHWDLALRAPAVAAANVLGDAQVWDPVPYFWSEQWGRMLQYAGHHPAGERVVWREDGDRWAAFWLDGQRLVAAVTVDRPRDLVQARHLMERDAEVDPDRLTDPGTPVKSAAV